MSAVEANKIVLPLITIETLPVSNKSTEEPLPAPQISSDNVPVSTAVVPESNENTNIPPKKTLDAAVNDVAQKALKKTCCQKIADLFSRIWAWIKSIPSKISDCFDRFLEADAIEDLEEDDDLILDQIDAELDEEDKINWSDFKNELQKFRKHIDPIVLNKFFSEWDKALVKLSEQIDSLKFNKIKDQKAIKLTLQKMNRYAKDLELNIQFINELKKVFEDTPYLKKLKEIEEKHVSIETAYKEKLSIHKEQIIRLEKCQAIKPNQKLAKSRKKLEPNHYISKEEIQSGKKPYSFQNGDSSSNDCWYNSTLCALFSIKPFLFDMIDEKAKEIPALAEKYGKEWADYEAKLKEYVKSKAQYEKDNEPYKAYKTKLANFNKVILPAYKALIETKKDEIDAYNRALEQHKQDCATHKKWEEEGKIGEEPQKVQPEEPEWLKEPIAPEEVKEVGRNPFKPDEPKDLIKLINGLVSFKRTVESGYIPAIRKAAKDVFHAIREYNPDFVIPGQQQDPSAFLRMLFEQLTNKFFDLETKRTAPVNGVDHYLEQVKKEPEVVLQLSHLPLDGAASFQELVEKNYGTTAPVDDNEEVRFHNLRNAQDEVVVGATEKITIKKRDNVSPEFLMIQVKRFCYFPTQAETEHVNRKLIEKHREPIINLAEELIQKDPAKYESAGAAEREAIETILGSRLKVYNGFGGARKLETKLLFPENYQINFANAFGDKDNRDDYQYELHATIIQHGGYGGGHYVSTVKADGQWLHCNDTPSEGDKIRTLNQEEVKEKTQSAYVYIFKRVPKVPAA